MKMPGAARWMCVLLCLTVVSSPAGAASRSDHGRTAAAVVRSGPPIRPVGPPGPPSTVLMEVSTGQELASAEPHRRLPPASLGKLMTFFLTLQAVKAGHLTLTTPVTVSVEAWRIGRTRGSSRMFLNVGDTVTIEELLQGMMVASGNDAAEVLAEAIAGSAAQFVEQMNAAAARLGMHDSHFVTPHGLPAPGEYTSAWDMSLLARQILVAFPDAVTYSSPRYATYGGIRQANWNNLVFRDSRVDGLKTGFTDEAGFDIVATARQGSMRLIAVVMGAHTLRDRTAAAEGLLSTGFSRYVLTTIPWERIVPSAIRVYGGRARQLPLGTPHAVEVLLPRESHTPLTISEELTVLPIAPFQQGQQVGVLTVRSTTTELATTPLVAAAPVPRGGLLTRVWGILRFRIGGLIRHRQTAWSGSYTPQE
jgi:D-alanyl-D-alanine carboxypeptidase (penicillin-binding protein 5/6)